MKLKGLLLLALLGLALAGCAAQKNFSEGSNLVNDGEYETGLEKILTASKLDQKNKSYRVAYFREREKIVSSLLLKADTAFNNRQWKEADNLYRRTLRIDPNNARAISALTTLDRTQKNSELLSEAIELYEKKDFSDALRKTILILHDDPSNVGALQLKHRIESKLDRHEMAHESLRSALRKPITLEFRDAPLQAVLDFISKSSKVNFILDKDIKPDIRITMYVKDVLIDDVLKFVLSNNQLESKTLNTNTLFIYPGTQQKLHDIQELEIKSFYLSNADVKQTANMIKTIVKTKDIYIDEKLNLLILRDTPNAMRVAEKLIESQDLAEPEVMLAVEVLEVSSSLLRELGIRYPTQVGASVTGAAKTPGVLSLPEIHNRNAGMVNVSISDPALLLNLMEQGGKSNILANPRIRVRNREKAKILIGDKVPVITTTSSATGFVAESVSYLDVGLKLDVEPDIHLDNNVSIKINLEVSNIAREILTKTGSLTYQVGTRTASTSLRLKDGETQILAGLISDEERNTASQVPGLGDLPLVGRLFSNERNSNTQTEVILLITPKIVRNLVRPDTSIEAFTSGTEAIIGAPPLELNRGDESTSLKETSEASPSPQDEKNETQTEETQPPSPSSTIKLNMAEQAASGESISMQIEIASENLQNAILDITYDPMLLQPVNVEEGAFLKQNEGRTTIQYQMQTKSNPAHIGIVLNRQGGTSGSGNLASILFKASGKPADKATVTLAAANLSDANGKPISVTMPPPVQLTIK